MTQHDKGCILIHGLTATPAVLSPLASALKKAGFIVNAPLLAGHGSTPEELMRTTWEDWYRGVTEAFREMRRDVRKIYCAGISLGSLLGLKLAADRNWGVRALACISTPLKLTPFVRIVFPLVWHSPFKHIYKFQSKDYMASVADPEGRETCRLSSYDRLPLRSVAEVRSLQDNLKNELQKVTTPLLLIHARRDMVAPLSNVDEVKKLVKSTTVEKIILERSHHVVTLDYEREFVAEAVVDFFMRFP